MTKCKLALTFVLLVGAVGLVRAQEKPQPQKLEFSLKEAQEYAIEHSYDVTVAKLEMKKADKQIGETRSTGLPQINASVEYQNFLDLATQLIPAQFFDPNAGPDDMAEVQFGTKHNITAGVTLSQLLFSGSYIVALKASRAYKNLSVIEHQRTKAQVRDAVRQAYTAVLVSEESVQVLDSMLQAVSKNVEEIAAMHKAGFVEETDVDQLELLRSNIRTQKTTAEHQLKIAYMILKYNLGIPPTDEITLKDNIDNLLLEFDSQTYLAAEFAVEGNIDFQAAKNMVRIYELQLLLEKSAVLPTLSGFWSYQKSANRNEFDIFDGDKSWFPTNLIGITLDIPIFSGFGRHYKIQKARVDLEIAQTQMQQLSDGLKLEFATAKTTYNSALQVYQNSKKDKEVAKKIYDRTVIKYEKGMATSLDLLQTHNQYLEKETQYYAMLQAFLNAKSAMDKVLTKFEAIY